MTENNIRNSQHKDHRKWIGILDFYVDEIQIFYNRLNDVEAHNSSLYSILEHTNEYRRILEKKVLSIRQLREAIKVHEHSLSKEVDKSIEENWNHEEIRKELQLFISKFESLKQHFRGFVSHHMG